MNDGLLVASSLGFRTALKVRVATPWQLATRAGIFIRSSGRRGNNTEGYEDLAENGLFQILFRERKINLETITFDTQNRPATEPADKWPALISFLRTTALWTSIFFVINGEDVPRLPLNAPPSAQPDNAITVPSKIKGASIAPLWAETLPMETQLAYTLSFTPEVRVSQLVRLARRREANTI